MKIVVDIYGGDYAPVEIIKGAVLAVNQNPQIELVLTGKQEEIESELSLYNFDKSRIEIIDADDVITNDESPTTAIKTKKNSSLVVALDYTKTHEDVVGMVSAGSTGAVLTGCVLKIGRIKGISRPALAPILPTMDGGHVLLIDCGANMDCKPQYLAHFALMGTAYMQSVCGIEKPRVALLSVGVEDKKGNELTKEAFQLLKNMPINFVGNMEARDILSGYYDVIVCDGFMGNVALKSLEGAVLGVMKMLFKELMGGFRTKLGAALAKPAFKKVRNTMDYTESGGAPFLGVEKVVIKSHGSSKAKSICASIEQVYQMASANLVENIREKLQQSDVLEEK